MQVVSETESQKDVSHLMHLLWNKESSKERESQKNNPKWVATIKRGKKDPDHLAANWLEEPP